MTVALTIDGREHTLELTRGEVWSCLLDGLPFEAEAVAIAPGVYSLLIGGKSFLARVAPGAEDTSGAAADSLSYRVQVNGAEFAVAVCDPRRWQRGSGGARSEGPQRITAPMSGKVVRLLVAESQRVEAGQGVVVVEAMKMQNEIKAPAGGIVASVLVREGQAVAAGETLLVIE